MPRLDRLIARCAGLSRRQATRVCRRGLVLDEHGDALRDPALAMPPSSLPRQVQLDGRPLILRTRYHLMQHKPRGVVTAHRDKRHPTAYALLEGAPLLRDLRAVGRLDLDTSGLLLWTTEGPLLHRLTHPRYAVERVYHAALARPWDRAREHDLTLEDGYKPRVLQLQELPARACHPALNTPPETACAATITLSSGKFHEVRRIFAALGSHVVGLCRVAYGPLTLPEELPAGEHRFVDLHEIFRDLHPRPLTGSDAREPPTPRAEARE